MEKVTHDKRALKILCIVLAAALWFYVSYQENPTMSKTVKNVPIAIYGEQALKENGFSVYSVSEKSVNVKVTAKRLILGKISNKTLSASINVSSIKEGGKHVIPATVNSGISSSASYYVKGKDITVMIEPIVKNTFFVEANFAQSQRTSHILKSHTISVKNATVRAPQSIMKEIDAIKTEEIVPDTKTSGQTVRLVAYGKDGKILDGVEFTPAEVNVSYTFYDVKTVPVVLKTSDKMIHALPQKYTVEVYGYGDSFESLKQIETEQINLAQFTPGSKVMLKLNLPPGVMLTGSSNEIEIELKDKYYE